MSKKTVAVFTLIIFSIFVFSCTPIKRIESIENMKPGKFKGNKVLAVVNANGKWIRFKKPGKMLNDVIAGEIIDKQGNPLQITIPLTKVRWVWRERVNIGKPLFRGAGIASLVSILLIALFPPDL